MHLIVHKLILIMFIICDTNKICCKASVSTLVTIQTNQSTTIIEGTQEADWKAGIYYAFRGIPYARPPIGALRFKDPQALESMPDYIDARYDGHDCPSIYATNASEDCLILNIYTKHLNPTPLLPVIVFIHTGGLYVGSSLSNFIGAEYLLVKDIVLVTFNYRLGTLGFLNLGTVDIPGNAGFKDQVYALRWLHKHIHHFGGNKADITLMGYSAGGLSVSLHLASPMSEGLFHKAIIMSGILPPQTLLPRGEQMKLAQQQASILNCSDFVTTLQILNCLNDFDGHEITATLRRLFAFGKDNPMYLWLPVIERDFGQERFLIEDFNTLMKRGEFQRMPILIGFNDGEFCTSAAELLDNDVLKARFYEEYEILAPTIFMYAGNVAASNLSEAIKAHYRGVNSETEWNFEKLCDVFSDALIRFGAHRIANFAGKYTNVEAYKFAYKGDYSNLNYGTQKPRVEHLDDLMYLFRMAPHHFGKDEKDAKVIELYTDFIFDFVKNGKISSNSLSFPHAYTLVTDTLKQQNGVNFDEAAFWDQLFP